MIINNLKNTVFKILKADDRIWNEEKNELNQTLLIDFLDKIDEKIIGILLDNEEVRGKFFIKIKDVFVFKTNDFKFFLEENKIYNSYTKYQNQIGLTDGKRFLKDSGDVVLDFPFKDCVLEGGQSTEEGEDKYFEYSDKTKEYEEKTAKRKEIFFNQVLAQDEIDRLFDEKALTGWKRFDKSGESEVKEIKRDVNGTIKENLIIKGNNLLALHSLKSQFAGKIKLIYIDPPYNTGNDGFKYNDNFNHSSWLTFMKNRLEVARDLLRDDGVIFVSCDDNELSHLKLIMDEIRELHFESIFHIKVRHENRILRQDNRYQKVMEHLLCYGKANYSPNRIFLNEDKNKNYQFDIKIKNNSKPNIEKINGYDVWIYKKEDYELIKTDTGSLKEYNIRGSLITQSGSASEFYEKFLKERKEKDGFGALYKVLKMGEKGDGIGYRFIRQPFDKKAENGFYYQGKPLNANIDKGNPYPNFYDFEKEFNNISSEGGISFKNGKKPEIFIAKILEFSGTKEGDIVLDFFGGSGTTGAVAHKMNRQYILTEQMDYIKDLPEQRLKNVVNGDQTGISKSVNWQGGGDFIYFELAKHNETAKEKILNCQNLKELEALFDELYGKYFLNYNLKIKEFKEKVLKEEEFKNLELIDQKKMFLTMLDLNQMYVNKSEMADKNFAISHQDQELTKEFYKSGV